jgi:hypothetical protein
VPPRETVRGASGVFARCSLQQAGDELRDRRNERQDGGYDGRSPNEDEGGEDESVHRCSSLGIRFGAVA